MATTSAAAASVIIPAHNAERTVGACLEAISQQRSLGPEDEVIVVDDHSDDGTQRVASRPGVSVITCEGRGPGAARNAGAQLARGDLLLFLDADTEPAADWLEELRAPFADPEVVAVKGRYFSRQRSLLGRFSQLEFEWKYRRLEHATRVDFVDTGTAAFRREAFLASGGFDETLTTSEDVDLAFRLASHGARLAFNPRAAVWHRHTDRLLPYVRKKARGAATRMEVYRRYPQKSLGDSYTPPAMGAQIGLVALLGASGLLAAARVPWAASLWGLSAAAFALSTWPLLRLALACDLGLAPLIPALVFLRAGAQGMGVTYGLGTRLLQLLRRSLGRFRQAFFSRLSTFDSRRGPTGRGRVGRAISANTVASVALVVALAVAGVMAHLRRLTFQPETDVVVVEHNIERAQWTPSFAWPSTGAVIVTGRLRNEGNTPSNLVRVLITLRDGQGATLGTAVGYPLRWELRPGGEATFIAPTFPDPRLAGYTVAVEEARTGLVPVSWPFGVRR